MKAIKTLIDAAFENKVVFYYHGNPVCVLNFDTKSFKLDHCGYKTSSTARTLNAYRDELTARGFTCSEVK